ncbi:hypothetical protein B0H16DRAFT_1458139 [Mycena metata]|uniref:Uncharacterized protein n=1 Tax=Mycena metata TaxID=1033252 RepID=A0AAD7J4R1_9AGAR|nr:hypothetical protein B0H16DRAFT_1458139 [Mycena metata]
MWLQELVGLNDRLFLHPGGLESLVVGRKYPGVGTNYTIVPGPLHIPLAELTVAFAAHAAVEPKDFFFISVPLSVASKFIQWSDHNLYPQRPDYTNVGITLWCIPKTAHTVLFLAVEGLLALRCDIKELRFKIELTSPIQEMYDSSVVYGTRWRAPVVVQTRQSLSEGRADIASIGCRMFARWHFPPYSSSVSLHAPTAPGLPPNTPTYLPLHTAPLTTLGQTGVAGPQELLTRLPFR